jgi:4-amino-4-deoxy-L-arabinose transferase-like glycosyltransferase
MWILVLVVAFATRLAFGFWWQSRLPAGQPFFFGDSDSYWQLGHEIAAGQPYEYRSPDAKILRTPGYPLLLAGPIWLFGEQTPVMLGRATSAVFGTLAVAVVGWWTTWLFDSRSGIIAAWLAALYPGAVSMGGFILSEAPFTPFMLLHLALWGLAWRSSRTSSALALALGGGVAGAVATLIRPSWLLFIPFALAIGVVFDRRRARQLVVGIAMSASFVACMLPWWIRNARVSGHFVATTLQFGASLYDGLRPTADGASDMSFVPAFVAEQRAVDRAAPRPDGETFEYRLDQRMLQASLDWARANPQRVLQLAAIKFARVWNVWPNEPSMRRWPIRLAILATYVPLLVCSIAGAWKYSRRGWPYVLAWLPAVYLSLLHMVFVSSIRYREPAMLALIVLAAGFVAELARGRGASDPLPAAVV